MSEVSPLLQQDLKDIQCVTDDLEGNLYFVCSTGDVFRKSLQENELKLIYNSGGQPNSLTINDTGEAYLCDFAHQCILIQSQLDEEELSVVPFVQDYKNLPLNGPNTVAIDMESRIAYFTDSGPLGDSTIQNPSGSLYSIDLESKEVTSILHKCLAYPWGVSMFPSQNYKILYVCETMENRVIRIVIDEVGRNRSSVFWQGSGRMGPSSIESRNGLLYLAHFDLKSHSKDGIILTLNSDGQETGRIVIPNAPEVVWLSLSKQLLDSYEPGVLFAVERSTNMAYKISLPESSIQ